MVLTGIENLMKVFKTEDEENKFRECKWGKLLDKECKDGTWRELYLSTDGTNLKKVLQHSDVDYVRTTTNDVQEISRVLGIEAARQAMIQEIYVCFNKY